MKKILIIAALFAFSTASFAQDTIQLKRIQQKLRKRLLLPNQELKKLVL